MSSFLSLCCQALTSFGSSVVSSPTMEFKRCPKLASNSEPVHLAFDCQQLHKDTEGKAPVIFLHGVTTSKENWGDIPKIVAGELKRKVYAVDLRHHGDSPWSETFEFDSNGLDLRHFMDTHNIDKAILVGHSMGGMIAIKFALEMPQKIEKLVVEEATLRREIPQQARMFLKYKLDIAKAGLKEIPDHLDVAAAHKLLPEIMARKVPRELKEFARFDEDTFMLKKENGKFTFKANIDAIMSALNSFPSTAIPEPDGRYFGSACFIYGKKSPFNVGSDKDIIRKYFPYAELVGVENASHTVHNDCRSEFLDILIHFLRNDCVARL